MNKITNEGYLKKAMKNSIVSYYESFLWKTIGHDYAKMNYEKFFYHSPVCIVESVSEYTFLISEITNKQQEPKKAKETKEEKIISPKNWLRK